MGGGCLGGCGRSCVGGVGYLIVWVLMSACANAKVGVRLTVLRDCCALAYPEPVVLFALATFLSSHATPSHPDSSSPTAVPFVFLQPPKVPQAHPRTVPYCIIQPPYAHLSYTPPSPNLLNCSSSSPHPNLFSFNPSTSPTPSTPPSSHPKTGPRTASCMAPRTCPACRS